MKQKILIGLILAGLVLISGCNNTKQEIIELENQIQSLQQENLNLKEEKTMVDDYHTYNTKALTEYNLAFVEKSDANYNYDLWSGYYDEGYCENYLSEAARDLYSSSNSHFQKATIYFEEAKKHTTDKIESELLESYIEISEIGIELNWAMYEACEYFEVACDDYMDGWYDAADAELEKGNENIRKHDGFVVDFNTLLAKIDLLEEQLI